MDRICQWGWPAMGTGGAFPVQSCTNSAIAWLQPPHRHCGCPAPAAAPSLPLLQPPAGHGLTAPSVNICLPFHHPLLHLD